MPKTTKRADGKLTISGLTQGEYDSLVSALTNARIAYRDSAQTVRQTGKVENVEMADRLMATADTMHDLGLSLAPNASTFERASHALSDD